MPVPTADEYIAALRSLIRELLPYVLVQDGGRLGPDATDDEATEDLHQAAFDLVAEEYLPVEDWGQRRSSLRSTTVLDQGRPMDKATLSTVGLLSWAIRTTRSFGIDWSQVDWAQVGRVIQERAGDWKETMLECSNHSQCRFTR